MDLNQIQYFLHLSETLNFTEAARRSGISQPSLTKSMQRLEEELGGPLVYRDGKDTRLTALGREMQDQFMRIDAEVTTARKRAETTIAGRMRELKIGVAQTISPTLIGGFVGHVLEQLPDVEVTIHQMHPGETEASILQGRYDLCVLPNPPASHPKLICIPIITEHLMFGLAHNHPLTNDDQLTHTQIASVPYIDRLHCEFRSQLIAHFMDKSIVMRPKIQSDREDWVQHLVATGIGVCALPEHSAMVDGVVVREISGLDLKRHVSIVAVSGSGNAQEVRHLLNLAQKFDWKAAVQQPKNTKA